MEHLLLKAATTATDQGTFEAVISTASVDREGDIVEPAAFLKALEGWTKVGKNVPLAWNHTDVVVGHIDATSGRVEGGEVIAKGWIDQSTERGAEAWRLVKSGTLSFSFGFLVPDGGATKLEGKNTGFRITSLDLFEISVVPIAPANNDTRVLAWKSLTEEREELANELQEMRTTLAEVQAELADLKSKSVERDKEAEPRSRDPLKESAMKSALDVLTAGAQPPSVTKETPKRVPDEDPDELRKRSRDLMLTVLTGIEVME